MGLKVLMTGLNCVGDSSVFNVFIEKNRLMKTYFGGLRKINKQSIQKYFLSKHWENDDDCIKLIVFF